uniref:Toll-like receptor 13 n=1 Tax=Crassostrea virginica TaxID=6565 RepID=A0A8B8ALJ6_CRAVI|nr:toll-like receptor 13 [Crassostrea virginica]
MEKNELMEIFLFIQVFGLVYMTTDLPNCTIQRSWKGIKVDCSSIGLDFFPDFCANYSDGFGLKLHNVSSNEITELDLSYNWIKNTRNNHFHCLTNLQILNLENNEIILNSWNFFKGLFSPLVSLLHLNLKHNSKNDYIDDKVFAELQNLQELLIDVPPKAEFGKGFSDLKQLRKLDVSGVTGKCFLRRLDQRTFENLHQIRFLDLSACNIKHIEEGSFSMMHNLTYLSLSFNKEMGYEGLQNVTYGLQFTNIEYLHMENIRCLVGPETELCRHHLASLSNTSLKELNLAGNRLNWMEKGVLKNLPKSLEKITFANNRLSMGFYTFEYRLLPNLKEVNFSMQLNPPSIFQKLTENCLENPDLFRCPYNPLENNTFYRSTPSITFYVSPKLETVYWESSRLFGTLGSFGISPPNLKRIYMRNNIWFKWTGPVHGFGNVTELDLSTNFCYNISTEFFSNCFGLKRLHIGDNNLGKSLSLDYKGDTFRDLFNLEFVNLSTNGIDFLHEKIFSNSPKVKFLILDSNKLFRWEVKINHMKNLSILDLSDNRLSTLSLQAMQDLENLFRTGDPELVIDLNNNRLSCSCRNLDFLRWLRKFRSHFKNYDNYTCMEDFSNLHRSINVLKFECKSYLLWYIIGTISGTLVISVAISLLIYKNRWKIRYLRYIANKKFHGYQKLASSPGLGDYIYDAYVSYNEDDISFVKHDMVQNLEEGFGLKLAIMHRDMVPCGDHAANIMDCICQSKHMICVVTRGYMESSWQMYELNMARMEGIEARRTLRFVHLILMPDVCTSKYPRTVRDFIRKGYYTEYPDDQMGNAVFWEKLKIEIQKDLLLCSLK